jgi:hypothetical protein
VVGVVMSLNAAMEEQRKKTIELANATVMSQSALEQMSEDFGTVSLTEQRKIKQDAALTNVTEKQMSAGQQYITEMESGQKLLAGVKLQQQSGISSEEIGKSVASNMANAVAQGVITEEQGTEIIAALGAMAGNVGITTAASGQFKTYTRDLTQTAALTSEADLASIQGRTTSYDLGYGNRVDANLGLATEGVNAYGKAVGGIDTINAAYDAKVKEAKTQKEINALERERADALDKQNKTATQIYDTVVLQKAALGGEFDSGFLTNIQTATGGTDNATYKTAEKINNLGADNADFKLRLQTQLESGTLSAESIEVLLGYGAKNKTFGANYDLAITAKGEVDVLNAIEQLKASGNENQIDTLVNVASTSNASAGAIAESLAFSADNSLTTAPGSIGQMANALDNVKAKWEDFKNATSEKAQLDAIVKIVGDKELAKTIKDSKVFQGLPAKQKKQYIAQMTVAATGTVNKSSEAYRLYAALAKEMTGKDPTPEGFVEWTFSRIKGSKGSGDGSSGNDNGGTETVGGDTGSGGSSEETISPLQRRMNRINAALKIIGLKEAKINKKYEERKKALEEIAKLNDQILAQQKDQLDIADALSRGDIASAARAAQQYRTNEAQRAKEAQMKALEDAQKNELASVMFKGKTRAELEARLAKLEMRQAKRDYRNVSGGGMIRGYAGGGMIRRYAVGGKVMSYFSGGNEVGNPLGSDTVPAMLTPGEFVVKRPAVQNFGVKNLEAINNGSASGSSGVYNYSISVNVNTDADPDQIARAVAQNVKRTDSYRIRGNRL